MATAVGWGLWKPASSIHDESPVLREVKLAISRHKYKHRLLFGSLVQRNEKNGIYMDACGGDSGITWLWIMVHDSLNCVVVNLSK